MRTFINQAAQGDLLIRRVNDLPVGLQKMQPQNGLYVVAHSEAGHNHVIDDVESVEIYETDDPLLSYMRVIEATEKAEAVILRHLRSFDTHEPISITPGMYEIRRQREFFQKGWRRAPD